MKKNKLFFLLLCLILVLSVCYFPANRVYAEETSAKAMVVIEQCSARILCEKNSNKQLPMASTTKIMTALTVLKNCNNIDEVVNVSDSAIGIEGTSMYLKKGEKLTVKDLLYGLMLPSGNDAAVALACHISKNEEEFVKKMNEIAVELGCKNTHFVNAHGLDAKGHFTSAYDLALITREALKNPIFEEISKTKNVVVEKTEQNDVRYLKNKNRLLNTYDGCIGVKTGFTDNAGRCFVSAVKRGNLGLICVVLNCQPMFEDSASLLDSCFDKYEMVEIVKPIILKKQISVEYGEVENVELAVKKGYSYPLSQEEKEKIEIKLDLQEKLTAPVEKDQIVGEMQIYFENQLLFSQKIYTMNTVKSVKFKDKFSEILEKWNI